MFNFENRITGTPYEVYHIEYQSYALAIAQILGYTSNQAESADAAKCLRKKSARIAARQHRAQALVRPSVFDFAETSASSNRKLFIFTIKKYCLQDESIPKSFQLVL